MLFRVYSIQFPRILNEQEENILVGEIRCVVDYWQLEFDKIINKFDRKELQLLRKLPTAGASMDMVKFSLLQKKVKILDYIKLGKDDNNPRIYKFCIATADLSLIKQKINVFGKEWNIKAGQLVDDGRMMHHVKEKVLPLIGFKQSQVLITTKEEEIN